MTSIAFDRIAHEYDETRGGEPRGRAVGEVLHPLFSRDGLTLEVGVGTGLVGLGLMHLGRKVVGVDLSRPMLEKAAARGLPVVQGDATRLPLRDESVDDAYGVWVLHLVSDMGAAIAEVGRVLRPGGRCVFVLSAPPRAAEDEVGRLFSGMGDALRGGPRPDDPDTVRRLAEDAGLSFVEVADVPGGEFEESPADIADRIERRVYSVLWDVTDEQWRAHVQPVVDRLLAMPEPERKRSKRYRGVMVVLEKREGPER